MDPKTLKIKWQYTEEVSLYKQHMKIAPSNDTDYTTMKMQQLLQTSLLKQLASVAIPRAKVTGNTGTLLFFNG